MIQSSLTIALLLLTMHSSKFGFLGAMIFSFEIPPFLSKAAATWTKRV